MASALARLHGAGVIHGDVSPGNVLLDVDGRPHLSDLGLGHIVGEVSPGVWGSDGYVAPEVVLGGVVTTAADVYSVGALGWLCLTGTVPGTPGLRPALVDVALPGSGPALSALVAALDGAIDPDAGQRPDADALAWSMFEAATPTPIHLVRGEDEVSAITYRLRAAVGGDDGGALGGGVRHGGQVRVSRRRRRPGARRPAVFSALSDRARGAAGRGRRGASADRGAHRRHAGGRRRPRGGGALLGALALALLLAVAVIGLGPGFGAGRLGGGSPVTDALPRASTQGVSASGSVPGDVEDPRLDAAAPATRARDLVASLADARAAAWRSGSPALLREADAPGSAAWSRDLAAVTELKRSGIRYTDLQHDVAQVSWVSTSKDRAVVRARIDTSDYVVTSRAVREPRPASTGVPVLIDLVRTEAGWRVSDVRGAP